MAESVAKRWHQYWQKFVFVMDSDPLEDIHSRVRRLEQAVFEAPAPRAADSASPVRTTE